MDDAGRVERAQPAGQRHDRRAQAVGVDTPGAADAVAEHAAGRELHHEVGAAVVQLADVVHGDDMRAPHAAKQLCLAHEAVACRRIVRVLRRQHLDRDVRIQRFVKSRDHDAEPT